MGPDLVELAEVVLDEERFQRLFRKSAVKRARRRGLLRNLAMALGNTADAGHPHRAALERLARDEDPLVQEHAAWALRRLG